MHKVITGLFENSVDAAAALQQLEFEGIKVKNIHTVANDLEERNNFAFTTSTKLVEGIAVGACAVGFICTIIGGVTTVGALASEGSEPFLRGAIVGALAIGGAGAAIGSVIGAAIGFSISKHEVKYCEGTVNEGTVLVGVNYKNDKEMAIIEGVFETFGVKTIASA